MLAAPHLGVKPDVIDERHLSDFKKLDDDLQREQIVALKFYTGYEHVYPNDISVYRLMSSLDQFKRTAIFHTGDCYSKRKNAKLKYAHPLGIDEVAVDHPNVNIVIAHMGYPWVMDAAEVCYKNENVYADMSGFVYDSFTPDDVKQFGKMLRKFDRYSGSRRDKVLFGSDCPVSDQRSYVEALREVTTIDITKYVENAKRAFRLK